MYYKQMQEYMNINIAYYGTLRPIANLVEVC